MSGRPWFSGWRGLGLYQEGIERQWYRGWLSPYLYPVEYSFPTADGLTGTTVPLVWIETALDTGTLVYAKVDLPDPSTYFGGYKQARLLSVGAIKRALSDRMGNPEAATFSATLSDHDRTIRAKLESALSRWFLNRIVTVRMISDEGRRALGLPRLVAIGYLRDYAPISPLQFTILAEDYLAIFLGLGENEQQIPKRTITRTDFPDCPTDQIGKAVPIVYGAVSDEASATAAPTLTGDAARGAYIDADGQWHNGWGDLPDPPSPPTNVTAVENVGGSLQLGDVPGNAYRFMVTSVDAAGVESDPDTFDEALATTCTIVANNASIDVSWTAPGVPPTKYRVYMGLNYYGPRWLQVAEVASPTVTVNLDNCPSFAEWTALNMTQLATGATQILFAQYWYYAVSALMADGETGLSATCFGESRGYRRPIQVAWNAVAGALEYRVYRRGAAGTWDRMWSVSAAVTSFDDDLLDTGVTFVTGSPAATGLVPLMWVGSEVDSGGATWSRFLVAGHAVKEIEDLFVDGVRVDSGNYGVTFACPGKAGYATYFPNTGNPQYRDLNGRRYTLVYIRGPQADEITAGNKALTANVQGIEDVGDGTGTLISDGFDQYLHAFRNWFLQDYQGGAWFSSGPTWPAAFGLPAIEVLDDGSFDDAKAVAATRIAGGYLGAWVLGANGTQESIRTWIQRLNLSLDAFSGFSRRCQFFVRLIDTSIDVLAAAVPFRQVTDIFGQSFKVTDRVADLENVIVYSWGRNYVEGTWRHDADEVSDAIAIANAQQTKRSQTVELWLAPNATQALDVASRRLTRTKEPPRVVEFTTGLQALNTELGDVIKVTHLEGIGLAGWTDRPIFVTRHELDPDKLTITLEGFDVDRLFVGAFILGDETLLAATWALADANDRQYGYLCDETTEEFSDGAAGKRLR